MNEKNLKKLYNDEIQNSAPDMDALWGKIEKNLPKKEPENVTSYLKKKPFITMKKCLAAAAVCAMLAITIPTALRSAELYKETENFTEKEQYSSVVFEEQEAAEIESTESIYEETNEANLPLSYDDLRFAESADDSIAECTGKPNGDDYFVEEDILAQTQLFVDAVVNDVYSSSDGECIYYEMSVIDKFADDTGRIKDTLTVSSCSPYRMKKSREYIIPLKYTDGGYCTVFDGVPQIEVTLDSGIVFYSGWKSLDGDAQSIIYPQDSVDDFFYDRMKFSYKKDITKLIEAWRKALEKQ